MRCHNVNGCDTGSLGPTDKLVSARMSTLDKCSNNRSNKNYNNNNCYIATIIRPTSI